MSGVWNKNRARMGIESRDWPDNVSSAWKTQPWLGRYDLTWNEPWHSPPVRVTLQQCHYYNQRYSREDELIGSEHTGTWHSGYPQFIVNNSKYKRRDFTWHSGYPQRSSWGVPTVSYELYSFSDEHPLAEFEIRIEQAWGLSLGIIWIM